MSTDDLDTAFSQLIAEKEDLRFRLSNAETELARLRQRDEWWQELHRIERWSRYPFNTYEAHDHMWTRAAKLRLALGLEERRRR